MGAIRDARTKSDIISAMNDENLENTIERKYNKLPEVFECTVLTGWEEGNAGDYVGGSVVWPPGSQEKFWLVRIRSFDDSDIFRPSPFDDNLTKQQIYERINSHRQAIVAYSNEAPKKYGVYFARYSGKNYLPPIVLTKYIRQDSRFIQAKKKTDHGTGTGTNGNFRAKPDETAHNLAKTKLATITATYDNWLKIGEALSPILDIIKKAESSYNGELGGTVDPYNNYNMAPQRKGVSPRPMYKRYYENKHITGNTWELVYDLQTDAKKLGERIFAVGAYQIAPYTMQRLSTAATSPLVELKTVSTGYQYKTSTSWKYENMDKKSQDAIGAYLMLGDVDDKHPYTSAILGGYFIGAHDDAEKAAHVLAKIWAGLPCQFPQTNPVGKDVARGQSYWLGTANNRAHTKPEAVVDAIKKAKAAWNTKWNQPGGFTVTEHFIN